MFSFLKNMMGGSSKASGPAPSPKSGLEQLRETEELLRKKLAHLEKQIEEQDKIIKENVNSVNKRRAIEALKRKKRLEEQVKQTEGTLVNVESQKEMLENASTNAAIMSTMAQTAKIMKQAHGNMNIDQVEETMDEIREQQEVAKEISNMITNPGVQQHDDDELLKELEQMQQKDLDEKMLQTDAHTSALPDVPSSEPAEASTSKISASKKKEDEELRELQGWAQSTQ